MSWMILPGFPKLNAAFNAGAAAAVDAVADDNSDGRAKKRI